MPGQFANTAGTLKARLLVTAAGQLLAMSSLLNPLSVHAGAWDYSATAQLSANTSDNPTLRDDDQETESLTKMLAGYKMDIQWADQNNRFSIKPRVTRDYYTNSDNSDLESTDIFLPGQYTYFNQRGNYGLIWDYREQSVLSTEADAVETPETGNFRADDTRKLYQIGGTLSRSLTPRDQVSLTANYQKTDYALDFTGRADQEAYVGSASYSRALDVRQKIGFGVNYSYLESEALDCLNNAVFLPSPPAPPNTIFPPFSPSFEPCRPDQASIKRQNESTNYSLTINYSSDLTETLAMSAKYGKRESDFESEAVDANGNIPIISGPDNNGGIAFLPFELDDSDSSGDTYDISLTGEYERYDFSLAATRTITPSSSGRPNNTTALRWIQEYEISPRLRGTLDLRGTERNSLASEGSDAPDLKTRTFRSELRLNYALTQKWKLNFSYRYNWREREEQAGVGIDETTATSNTFNLSVVYAIKKLTR